MTDRNHTTPEGFELGRNLARMADDAEPKARLRMPELQPRCQSCAFRAGPHIASGSPFTQMDAMKCVIVETDVDVDFESTTHVNWIIGKVDRSGYERLIANESAAIALIKSSEKTRRKSELAKALLAHDDALASALKQLPISGNVVHDDGTGYERPPMDMNSNSPREV